MRALDKKYDIAVIGSGFAGSLLAMITRRLGHSVILLEKFKHPRFVIGESSTPLANLLLEELATRYDLPRVMPLSKWGTWQQAYPQVACGLKRGFTFYHHTAGHPFEAVPDRSNQLLVAASPHDAIADTHWYRPDFDQFLLGEARDAGAEYLDETLLDAPLWDENKITVNGNRHGGPFTVEARFLVDATGPRGYLHRALNLPEMQLPNMPATQGLYTHFTDVRRLAEMDMCPCGQMPPYPIDDAAVHHVFDGGWIWVLRFNNGITSAGVAAEDWLANHLNFADGAPGWQRLMQRLPTVAAQFAEAKPQFPFVHARRLSFFSKTVVGPQWVMLPSAAGFIDPLLSTGFPLTLLGVARLAEIIETSWGKTEFSDRLQTYSTQTAEELLAAERLVAALYANMKDFEVFSALSLLYFAAASFTETARRLGRPQLSGAFLMHNHPRFGPHSRSCIEQALLHLSTQAKINLLQQIQRTIEPIDIAGLSDSSRRNWYPVHAGDLCGAVHKLDATAEEIYQLLKRCGF